MERYAASLDASSRTITDSVRACDSISMKLMTSTLSALDDRLLIESMYFSAACDVSTLLYEKLSLRRKRAICVSMSDDSLRFLPSSSSSSTHSAGYISFILLGISPEKIALRAYCVAVGSMLV